MENDVLSYKTIIYSSQFIFCLFVCLYLTPPRQLDIKGSGFQDLMGVTLSGKVMRKFGTDQSKTLPIGFLKIQKCKEKKKISGWGHNSA